MVWFERFSCKPLRYSDSIIMRCKDLTMFHNTFQSGLLSILYSIGSKPLQIWDKKVSSYQFDILGIYGDIGLRFHRPTYLAVSPSPFYRRTPPALR
uniref:CFA20 domain-containing protein n=1 Tax=Parascaris equorum TaxID=6256 RepID=A0A914RK99_PAREQ